MAATPKIEREIGVSAVAEIFGVRRETITGTPVYDRALRPRMERLPSGRIRRWYVESIVREFAARRAELSVAARELEKDCRATAR